MLIGYARVSTRDQKAHLQLDALRDAGCEKIFEETASGARRDRSELNAALDFMRSGDTLVVWKLDRLARSTRQLLETVEMFERRKIGLKAITQDIDTTNAGGRLIFTVFGAIAEFEREIIREGTRAGLDAARSRVRKGGRPRALTDKDLKQARALLTDPEITVEEVARRFGVGPSTLYRYLPAARQADRAPQTRRSCAP
jgi:DNA invertase Pin-like site-specific DNA recombinase